MRPGNSRHSAFAALAVLSLILTACGGAPSVKRVYFDRQFDGSARKILVVGVHENRNQRGRFERAIASELAANGAQARALSSEIGTEKTLEPPSVTEVARNIGADGVLVTRVTSSDFEIAIKQGRTETRTDRRGEKPADLFRYRYTDIADPDELQSKQSAIVVADFYMVDTGVIVWTIESSSFGRDNLNELLNDLAEAIAQRMRRDGLIRRNNRSSR